MHALLTKNARNGRRGNMLIGVLIVVAIILVVMMLGPFNRGSSIKQAPQAIRQIEQGGGAACLSNRQTIKTELAQMLIFNNGKLPPLDQVRAKLRNMQCPRGGSILIAPDGSAVYCTKHDPPPLDELKDLVPLFEAKVETPIPLPQATPMQ